jgi:hypothetical protein
MIKPIRRDGARDRGALAVRVARLVGKRRASFDAVVMLSADEDPSSLV